MNSNLNNALILMDQVIYQMEAGSVYCNECGGQEDTKTLGFVEDIKEANVKAC